MTEELAERLIKKLEAGETGREIDAEIMRAFNQPHAGEYISHYKPLTAEETAALMARKVERILTAHPVFKVKPHPYSTSLDAAVALVERVRPNHSILMAKSPSVTVSDIHTMPLGDPTGKWPGHARAPTPAAALIAALLRSQDTEA